MTTVTGVWWNRRSYPWALVLHFSSGRHINHILIKCMYAQHVHLYMLFIYRPPVTCELAVKLPQDLTKLTLEYVMACGLTAPSHYQSQCWPKSMSRYGITRHQWVNHLDTSAMHPYQCHTRKSRCCSANDHRTYNSCSYQSCWFTINCVLSIRRIMLLYFVKHEAA